MVDKSATIGGQKVTVKAVSARVYFDIQDAHEGNDRDINMALMAASVVDKDGKQVYTAETVQDLPLPDFQHLQKLVAQANAYEADAGKD